MKIIEKNIDELIPYEHNPRRNALGVEPVAKSIQKFHFRNPIQIDKKGVVVAGHTRLLAAKKLGMQKVPCIVIDDLTDDELKAYRIADNKTGEFTSWDEALLKSELGELSEAGFDDISSMGFNEISHMMAIDDVEEESAYVQEPLPDKKTFAEYEQKANTDVLESFNVIIGCSDEVDKEWLSALLNETDRLKRFYTVHELKERDLI